MLLVLKEIGRNGTTGGQLKLKNKKNNNNSQKGIKKRPLLLLYDWIVVDNMQGRRVNDERAVAMTTGVDVVQG